MADVKEVLYSVIDSIGREKIRAEVSSDVDAGSRRYCKEIIEICRQSLSQNDEELGTLCEALLHFMLTASLLPSERKVTVGGIDLDVVIPSTKSLSKNPDKTLVVQVIKVESDKGRVAQTMQAQSNHENIWTVSAKSLQIGARNYSLDETTFHYSALISDIRAFLAARGNSSLTLLH